MSLGGHARSRGAILDSEQDGKARAVDVGVEKRHAKPLASQRESEVDGDGALADAPLTGTDRHDVLHRGESHLAGPRIATSAEGPACDGSGLRITTSTSLAPNARSRLGDDGIELLELGGS